MERVGTGFEGTFRGLGNDIRENMPKIKIGGNIQPLNDPLVDKFKRWLLIGLSALVAGGAIIMIMVSIIKRIF